MTEEEQTIEKHATTFFDPEIYVHSVYSWFNENEKDPFVKFILDNLHDIFADGQITGKRLFDIGTGPVCHSVYAASHWFDEIVLSDLSYANLDILKQWKKGDKRSIQTVFEYMLHLEGSSEDWKVCNDRLARKVTSIVHYDVLKKRPVQDSDGNDLKFDTITSSMCLNVACLEPAQYRHTLSSISDLLVPEGYLVVVDTLAESFYSVGKYTFPEMKADKEILHSVFETSGFHIEQYRELIGLYDPSDKSCDGDGVFVLVAKKV